MMHERRQRATEAFFGRRRGKALTETQAGRLDADLPRLRLDLSKAAPADLATLFPGRPSSVRMEIGFGGGEHLMRRAAEAPQDGFIGVEPFVNGMAKLVRALRQTDLDNIRLYDDDATRVLDWLPAGSIDQIDLLYPDPWPKPRHFKRRFVSKVNLDRFARVLKPGARFHFASDIDTYVDWTLNHCDRHAAFEWLADGPDDWQRPYEGWPGTRYEAKAIREGRPPAYLRFRRI
ncbi:tRNA (guanine(46)-N(7))-methyltransferase TrmB [Pararhizobium haloflavum]|uniref:tRNA (guanine(46)-N(7))-methyltransferase TrmB n=1 Tax=Pararhizobium haloflavum TaxID=2037914 RepID=UPI000C1A2BFD|nr:tRNA (guanine(46)-N(7))-methyltransferase TrmB [Pararhizobium haloflavum]